MREDVKQKIAKVYELVNRGEGGEKEAAKEALDRLIKRYNLSDSDVETIHLNKYRFKYSSTLDMWLLTAILDYFIEKEVTGYRDTYQVKEVVLSLEYLDYVVVSSAYEYFKAHMKKQYKKMVLPHIKRCRTPQTKSKRRQELQGIFFSNYRIASNLYKPEDVENLDLSKISPRELENRLKLQGVEGGEYKVQVSTGLYLE